MQRYIPAAAFWTFILTAICGVIHLIAQNNTAVADFFNFKVNAVFRAILATLTGGVIEGAEAASKSFPDFFEKLASLGVSLRVEA